MSSLSEKIKAVQEEKDNHKRKYTKEYRDAVWTLLIAYGGVFVPQENNWRHDEVDYYGAIINVDLEETVKAAELITFDSIDWESLEDPAEHVGYGFNGTFTSTQLRVPYLKGILKLKDGTEFVWLVAADTSSSTSYRDDSFSNVINLLQLDISFEEALENLHERIAKAKKDRFGFSYFSVLPSI